MKPAPADTLTSGYLGRCSPKPALEPGVVRDGQVCLGHAHRQAAPTLALEAPEPSPRREAPADAVGVVHVPGQGERLVAYGVLRRVEVLDGRRIAPGGVHQRLRQIHATGAALGETPDLDRRVRSRGLGQLLHGRQFLLGVRREPVDGNHDGQSHRRHHAQQVFQVGRARAQRLHVGLVEVTVAHPAVRLERLRRGD